jgi:hypothetical protein
MSISLYESRLHHPVVELKVINVVYAAASALVEGIRTVAGFRYR